VVTELAKHLEEKASFFNGAHAILNTGPREPSPEEIRHVRELLSTKKMEMCAVKTDTESATAAAESPGIPATLLFDNEQPQEAEGQSSLEPEEGLFMKRTVRSGQTVQYPGHVPILGDVNPGDQIVAGGDVVIWGRLRGTVHAGGDW